MRYSDTRAVRIIAFVEAAKGVVVLLAATGILAFIHADWNDAAARLVRLSHMNPHGDCGCGGCAAPMNTDATKQQQALLRAAMEIGKHTDTQFSTYWVNIFKTLFQEMRKQADGTSR